MSFAIRVNDLRMLWRWSFGRGLRSRSAKLQIPNKFPLAHYNSINTVSLKVSEKEDFDMRHMVNQFTLLTLLGLLVVAISQLAFGPAIGAASQSTQERRDARNEAGADDDIRALEPGTPHRREMAGGQRHGYRISLGADQFMKAVVEQDGIDVKIQVLDPSGKRILDVDSEIRAHGQETLSLVCEAAGDYRLIVIPKQQVASSGRYEIRIAELRIATNDDRALQEARRLIEKGLEPQREGKYDEALPLIARALEIRESILGPGHPDVASTINILANLYYSKGDYAKAEPLYQRALDIREKALGPNHPQVASSLNNLANLFVDLGDYVKAEPLHLRSLAIWEKALGPEHPGVADVLNNLALLYDETGEYAKAEPLHLRALGIREKALGPNHPDVSESLNNLGIIYLIKGKYAEAEPLYQRALSIREKVDGLEHPLVSDVLNNLALLYCYRGEYAKAEPLYRRALAIREKALGPDHPANADTLNNLADLFRDRGAYEKAEAFYQRALIIREKALGRDHHEVARVLNNLGTLYRERGEYAKAELLHQRALAIFEKAFGPEHPDVADSLSNLASLYRNRGEYVKAESFFHRVLTIRKKALGAENPRVANALNDLAALYMAKGEFDKAISFQSSANSIAERNLALNLAFGSERQKLAYLALLSRQTDQTLSLHLRNAPNDTTACRLAAALILQRKGRALDATSENLDALRSHFDEGDRALFDQLTETRSQLAMLILDGSQKISPVQYSARVKSLEDQADALESEISRRSNEYRAQSMPITLEAAQAAIPDDAALIEFASYHPFNPKVAKDDEAYGRSRYVAYVLRRQGEIKWKELGDAKAIDEAVARLRRALRDPKREDVKDLASALDRKIFRPLQPLLGDQTRLLVSPEGTLNLIPFAPLVDERGRYLVENYSISYLSSGRDLLRLQVARKSQSGPLVVANPDFGGRHKVVASRLPILTKAAPGNRIGEESPGSVFSQFYFPSLPHTAEEGAAISELLPGATLLTRRLASKEALRQAQSPEVLHIATHGFFLKDLRLTSTGGRSLRESSRDASRRLKQTEKDGSRIENPLLRAGLALAGANDQKEGGEGILTALEMTGLNLWGTKLVTLSACDTGVGEVRNGDGVYGLRRALALAGAETQVMSLWAVSDRWTRELMVAYYQRLQRGQGRGASLRQAQLEMLKDAKRRHPYYWAGFIQSGEWANLDGKRE
jgi:CHAT domain-containing protein/Tfp pilus assembly protein PilF